MQPLKLPLLILPLLCLTIVLHAQVHYRITYTDSVTGRLGVGIEPDTALLSPVSFVMPRSVPGNYGIVKYDQFVEHLQAVCADGKTRPFVKSSYGAPRWRFDDSGMRVKAVIYEVNLQKMDERIHSASDKSIFRQGFAGLLNYSVLGWIDGLERRRVDCMISGFPSWPIFSTLAPAANPARGRLQISAADYYTLADAQTYLGPAFRVKEYKALVPLFVADYTEGREEYMDDYGWQESTSMAILKDYFGALPFPCYTVLLRNAHPRPDDDPGNFGMMIKAMPLQQLSQTASTQYAEDFRLGTAVYSRGRDDGCRYQ